MKSRTRFLPALMLLGGFAWSPAPATADSESLDHCPGDTAARIRFIEERLEQRRTYALWWWRGWTAGYGAGTVVESVEAGTEGDTGRRADYTVSAVKAAFGTVRLALYPPTARLGAEPMRAIAPSDAAACQARLETGETLLRKDADEAGTRWSWKRHLANVAINMAGAVVVTEGFDENRGWASAGVGIAVGEAMLFSHPWQGDDDLAEYESRFGAAVPPARRVSWQLVPWHQGVQFQLAF